MTWTSKVPVIIVVLVSFLIGPSVSILNGFKTPTEIQLPERCHFPSTFDRGIAPPVCAFYRDGAVPVTSNLSCPEPGVLLVRGDYKALRISCWATYPLDFNFNGITPTEALNVTYERIQNEGDGGEDRDHFPYEVNVDVFSVPMLDSYYKKLPHFRFDNPTMRAYTAYSRTGGYLFSGYHDLKNISTYIYIFFEEADVKPNFLRSKDIRPTIHGTDLTIPCRPTHYESAVTVQIDGKPVKPLRYSPIAGVNLTFSELHNEPDVVMCRLKVDDGDAIINFSIDNSTFNVSNIEDPREGRVYISSSHKSIGFGTFGTTVVCRIDEDDDFKAMSSLNAIGADNAAMFRLLHEFVLPDHMNRSYSLVLGNRANDLDRHLLTRQIDVVQVISVFCGNRFQNVSITLSSVISGETFTFSFNEDWRFLNRTQQNTKRWFLPGRNREDEIIYDGDEVEFKCRISIFVFVPPCIWYVHYKNGTVAQAYKDHEWRRTGTSYFKTNVTHEMDKVYCAASIWLANDWWNDSISIPVLPCTKPVFDQNESSVQRLFLNSKQIVKCSATGIPLPNVYWKRQGKIITNMRLNYSLLEFSDVKVEQQGEYECVADNCGGDYVNTKKYVVSVYKDTTTLNAGVIAAIAVIIIISSWVGASVYIKFYKNRRGGLTLTEIEEFMTGEAKFSTYNFQKDACLNLPASSLPYNKQLEVSKDRFQVEKNKILGEGASGIVYEGLLDGVRVAVKTVKDDMQVTYLKSLLAELKVMMYIGSHEYLVQLLGAHTSELTKGRAFLFVDICPLGSLNKYLQTGVPNVRNYTLKDMHNWSGQIASGMAYLTKTKVIHGDLAARNVLLTEAKTVKITDFGLSRRLYEYEDYVRRNEEKVPWRWLAIESLRNSVFSFQSDIWAYGVTLWEIFSLADTPYADAYWGMAFVTQIENGKRLSKPEFASDKLYELMKKCWSADPAERPCFEDIRREIGEMATAIQCPTSYVCLSKNILFQSDYCCNSFELG